MEQEVKDFIEEHVDLIEQGYWGKLYGKAYMQLKHPGRLTQVLLKANIKPLEDIDYIPHGYLMDIEENDEWIYRIPKHIKTIHINAFSNNNKLIKLYIPKSVIEIKNQIIQDDDSLLDVYYEGSEKDWDEIKRGKYWAHLSPIFNLWFNVKM